MTLWVLTCRGFLQKYLSFLDNCCGVEYRYSAEEKKCYFHSMFIIKTVYFSLHMHLFWEANTFQRVEEKCELRGTANVQEQISKHIFSFWNLENITPIFPCSLISWRVYDHVTPLDQWRASENIWWITRVFIWTVHRGKTIGREWKFDRLHYQF